MQKRKEKKKNNFLKQKFTFFNNLFLENMYGGCLTILIFSCGINNKMHQCLFHEEPKLGIQQKWSMLHSQRQNAE